MVFLFSAQVMAAFPMQPYPECGQPDRPDLCPDDLEERWEYLSYVPSSYKGEIPASEADLGTGMWADQAWRTQVGNPEVVIAVIDSGVLWDDEELANKHWLNAGELPYPWDEHDSPADSHDLDGDGLVTLADYAVDSRVDWTAGIAPGTGDILDPSDLIQAFSDSVDDDGNGYVDDIASWDFFWNDNDPYDDTRYDHGTFEAILAAAEGGDGKGRIGTCPNCRVMHVRVGDSYISDPQAYASALAYSVDSGASVVIVALGGIGNTPFVQQATDYAWQHDVLVVASAADEAAYHQNYPGAVPHTLLVHAVNAEDDPEEATSFLAYSNCTNHGARLDLSVPSPYCSSGAAALTGGVAGLVLSEAMDRGIELSAGELWQILVSSSDDIALQPDPELARTEQRYPSQQGWDRYFGFGRLNAWAAVQAVVEGEIPPEVELTSPMWFHPVDPQTTPEVVVEGLVRADRGQDVSWTLEVGAGIEPQLWSVLSEGSGPMDGSLGTLVLSDLEGLDPNEPMNDYSLGMDQYDRENAVNKYTVTLRLTATDSEGITGRTRRAFAVRTDPDLLPGFPLDLGASLESSPNLVDFDGDGAREIIIGDASGRVHVIRSDGTEFDGWPVVTTLIEEVQPGQHLDAPVFQSLDSERYASVIGGPAVGDLDGDGALEIVAADLRGAVYCWDVKGNLLPGFPTWQDSVDSADTGPDHLLDEGFFGAPSLGDLDGDGDLEIVIGGMDQQVYAWHHDGQPVEGWPVAPWWGEFELTTRIISSGAIGDLDGDGNGDVVIGTNETLNGTYGPVYAISGEGNSDPAGAILPGWPVAVFGAYTQALPYVGEGVPSTPTLADFDRDGDLEVAAHTIAGEVVIFQHDGSEWLALKTAADRYGSLSNANDAAAFPFIGPSAIGDLDGDGVLEVVTGAIGSGYAENLLFDGRRSSFDHLVGAWSSGTGMYLPGWPRVIEDMQFFVNPAIADIDGDRVPEVITGSAGWVLHAWDKDGFQPAGWPKFLGHWMMHSPAVGDIDGDGFLDVVAGTRQGTLFAFSTDSNAGATVEWAGLGHDPQNSFNYETPLDGYNMGYPEDDRCGCGCGGGKESWLVLLGLGAWVRRRRRREVAVLQG